MKNKIVYKNYEFTDETILEGKIHLESSLASDELTADSFDFNIIETAGASNPLSSVEGDALTSSEEDLLFAINYEINEPLTKFKYGEPVRYYRDEVLVGTYYLNSIQRISKKIYKFECSSAIGILTNRTHYGGIYQNRLFKDCVAELMRNVAYRIVDEPLKTQLINGWLPIATARDNLQQLLFAVGANIYKDWDGTLIIAYNDATTAVEISRDRLYMDGASVEYTPPATSITVLEHSYFKSNADVEEELFSSLEIVNQKRITFNGPYYDLRTSGGLTIVSSGANTAVVSGNGSLYGKPYSHSTKEQIIENNLPDQEDFEVRVENATLVNSMNSYYVARRVASFYGSASEVSYGIVMNEDDYAGKLVKFTDPFGVYQTGFIKSLDITMSKILKANAKIITDYIPGPFGNNYTNYIIINNTSLTSWRVPSELFDKEVLITLIGGGDGGKSGQAGTEGYGRNNYTNTGIGGEGGLAGDTAKILQFTETLTRYDYVIHIGQGGRPDSVGEDTIFMVGSKTYNSGDGQRSDIPFVNIFTGEQFAVRGEDGIKGGDGDTKPQDVIWKGITYKAGKKNGGYGGGAAVGQDGGDGKYDDDGDGRGGKGADATINGEDAPILSYGSSGSGGHGGGGGGRTQGYDDDGFWGNGGAGGLGSLGGNGAQGCIIIYY